MLELSGFFTESDHSLQRLREAGLGGKGQGFVDGDTRADGCAQRAAHTGGICTLA